MLSSKSSNLSDCLSLDSYIYLIDHSYINGNVDEIINDATSISVKKGFFKSEGPPSFRHRIPHSLYSKQVISLFSKLQKNVEELGRDAHISTLQKVLISSWSEASPEIYQSYELKPFLHGVSKESLIDGILNNWTTYDVIVFGQFMESRYKTTNIYEYLSPEFSAVNEITEKLSDTRDSMPVSMKKGQITELVEYLNKAVSFIDKAECNAEIRNQATESD